MAAREPSPLRDFTTMLGAARRGDRTAEQALIPVVYDELLARARAALARERKNHTLQPTALVHEAWLKLFGGAPPPAADRRHFLALAARAMRQVLVDHARLHAAQTRAAGEGRVTLAEDAALLPEVSLDVLAVEEALARLEQLDPRQAQVVELRFFGGLSVDDVAETLGLSRRSVEADWTVAKAFLKRELAADAS